MSEGHRSSFAVALSRRRFIANGACFALAFGSSKASGGDAPTLRFGLTPVFLNHDIQLLDALKVDLEAATGHSVELVTYQDVTSLPVAGQLDAAPRVDTPPAKQCRKRITKSRRLSCDRRL